MSAMPASEKPLLICVPDDPTLWFAFCGAMDRFRRVSGPAATPRPGSIEGTCVSCDCKIWIGPNQQKLMPRPALCLVCGIVPAVEGSPLDRHPRGLSIDFDRSILEGGGS